MVPAALNMYGRKGCHRAIDTAPETPSSATVHGPMQHRPTNEANMLKPTALPLEAMIFFRSCMYPTPRLHHLGCGYRQYAARLPGVTRNLTGPGALRVSSHCVAVDCDRRRGQQNPRRDARQTHRSEENTT